MPPPDEEAPAWETGATPEASATDQEADTHRVSDRQRAFLAALAALLDDHADRIAWALRTRGGVFPDVTPCQFKYPIRRTS